MANLISCGGGLLPPGVRIVRPRLLGFRRGGVGGFTKAGDSIVAFSSEGPWRGKLVVDVALAIFLAVLTARFFKFRPFLAGGCFCSSK